MNDTVTILGRVGADPTLTATSTGDSIVKFRVASPQRHFDSKAQAWVESNTNWYTVSAFRQLADHAKASLRQGDGVIIMGKLKLREWESGGRKGMSADIDADAIGHDLRWGASAYIKASSTSPAARPVPNADGYPPADNAAGDIAVAADDGSIDADERNDDERNDGDGSAEESEMEFSGAPWGTSQ